jgi:hypothetical protein
VSSSVLNVTFDCSDAASVAQFWSEVTRWPCSEQEMPGNAFWVVGVPGGSGPRLVFVNVPEPKTVKNRVHLDLVTDGAPRQTRWQRLRFDGSRQHRTGGSPCRWQNPPDRSAIRHLAWQTTTDQLIDGATTPVG